MKVQEFNDWMEYHDALHPMLENSIFERDDLSIERDLRAGTFPPRNLFNYHDTPEGVDFWSELSHKFYKEIK